MKGILRKTICIAVVLLIWMTAAGCSGEPVDLDSVSTRITGAGSSSDNLSDEEVMKIHFIDVGQGDCTFIDYGDKEILVDCGEWEYSRDVIDYIAPYVDGALDMIIATHPDSDHIGGMMYIFDRFQVAYVVDSGAVKDTVTYYNYMDALENEQECIVYPDDDLIWEMGGNAYVRIIETGDEDEDVNEVSVVSEVVFGDISVLLTGDMGSKTERENLDKFEKVTVLKAAHHGSSKSTCSEFLNRIKPEYAIISAGKDNSYGHPHWETLERLDEIGAVVYYTMNSGTIVMETDGKTCRFENEGSITVTEPSSDPTYSAGNSLGQNNSVSEIQYVGNKNSGKFHQSSCSSVSGMSEKNRVYFGSRSQAVNEGYEPCGACNP
ncbi:MAG: MBL fold metallo-hydrolase [Bacillota bacterium]|nr:MBL fold metallo-hydrolase [Bacillota bacterium]